MQPFGLPSYCSEPLIYLCLSYLSQFQMLFIGLLLFAPFFAVHPLIRQLERIHDTVRRSGCNAAERDGERKAGDRRLQFVNGQPEPFQRQLYLIRAKTQLCLQATYC